MKTLIAGGTVVTATATLRADVLIDGEKIAAVGQNIPVGDCRTIDAAGKYVLPGGIDVHTHLDMPLGSISSSDDFYTGHVAAAFGGTTTHIDFCNQSKGQSLHEALDEWHAKARNRACIDYGFHVTLTDITERVLDEIATLPAAGVTSIKMLMAYKGRVQIDDSSLFLAMGRARDAGMLTMTHCENGDVIDVLIHQALAEGNTEPKFHYLTRPPQLEGEATGRAIAMSEILDAPLYIVHVTCRPALTRIYEAQQRGARVWAESCVQYLFFTEDDVARGGFDGAKWVCSPPFRTGDDQVALWTALRDGALSIVSTDHCPFRFDTQKVLGRDDFSRIPNGCPGIEDRLQMLHHAGVNEDRIDLNRFVALSSTNPALLFGLYGRKGDISPGFDADLVIWDMNRTRTVSLSGCHSAVDYNLYEGMTVRGIPQMVFLRGDVIVDGEHFLGEAGSGKYLPRDRFAAMPLPLPNSI